MSSDSTVVFICLGVIIVALSSVASGSATTAFFHDTETVTASVASADTFPPTDRPYAVDDDGNIVTLDPSDLQSYDNPSEDIVIPEGTGAIDTGNQQSISITAKSISSDVDLRSKNADISLTATEGDIDLGGTGTTIDGGNGGVSITASGDVNLTDATITTDTHPITIEAGGKLVLDGASVRANNGARVFELTGSTVSAKGTTLFNKNGDILLAAEEGSLDATGASITISGGSNLITLQSVGSMYLESAAVDSGNRDPVAELSESDGTLYVEGTTINGGGGTLYYSPAGITIDPASRDGNDLIPETN